MLTTSAMNSLIDMEHPEPWRREVRQSYPHHSLASAFTLCTQLLLGGQTENIKKRAFSAHEAYSLTIMPTAPLNFSTRFDKWYTGHYLLH